MSPSPPKGIAAAIAYATMLVSAHAAALANCMLALVVGLVSSLSGCAAIVTGRYQPVTVETAGCPSATCRLVNQKGSWLVSNTPGAVTVHRAYGDMAVTCERGPYKSNPLHVASTTKAMVLGNIILGGIIGAAVDTGTGAAYDYPSTIAVAMVCSGDPATVVQPAQVPSATELAATTSSPAIANAPPAAVSPTSLPQQQSTPLETRSVPTAERQGGLQLPAPSAMERGEVKPPLGPSKFLYSAEQFAKASGCPAPLVTMNFSAPGAETFTIKCAGSEPIAVRCEYGQCRALQ